MTSCRAVQAVSRSPVSLLKQVLSVQSQQAPTLTSSTQNPSIRCLSSLSAHHRRQFQRLTSLMDRAMKDEKRTLVACSVVSHQHPPENCSSEDVDVMFCATGVNHSLHRQFNGGKTLKGILRGCAEQNALGAAAASGHRYSAITDVYLYTSCSSSCQHRCKHEACDRVSKGLKPLNGSVGVSTLASVKGAVFPCPECWGNLLAVAEMRSDDGESGLLNLFIHVHNEAGALRSVSVARQCMATRSPPAIDVMIVLPG